MLFKNPDAISGETQKPKNIKTYLQKYGAAVKSQIKIMLQFH
jgi:hypothetical protein